MRDHDAVTFPAEDGGYVLIGIKIPSSELFDDIEWGSERVMVQTRQRLAALGWRWSEPMTLWDVDHPGDLERLALYCPELRDNLSPGLEIT